MKQQVYLNPESGMIATTDRKANAPEDWLYIGEGTHKKVINWLVQLNDQNGDFMEADMEALRKSFTCHSMP